MILYLGTIVILATIQIVWNWLTLYPLSQSLSMTLSSIALCIAIDIFFAWGTHKRVGRVKIFSRFYVVSERNRRFWAVTGARTYKNLVPDLGKLIKFPKGTIQSPSNAEYLERYLRESCVGEAGHWFNAFCGVGVVFWLPIEYAIHVGLWVFVVNFVLNMMAVGALRYNRFTLYKLYKRATRGKAYPGAGAPPLSGKGDLQDRAGVTEKGDLQDRAEVTA